MKNEIDDEGKKPESEKELKLGQSAGQDQNRIEPNSITANKITTNTVNNKNNINKSNIIPENIKNIATWGILFIALYLIISNFPLFTQGIIDPKAGLVIIFFIGFLTSFHCIGMCGGFVVSYATQNKDRGIKPHVCYNGTRVLSYTLLGAIVGLIGSVIAITDQIRGILAFLAGLFMLIYGLSIFYPRLRKFVTLPSLFDITKYSSNPALFGFLNGFMPCGPLQAMLIYAAGTGSMIEGGLTMIAFGLGTLPLMFLTGTIVSKILFKWTHKVVRFASVLMIVLGIIMLQRSSILLGIGVSIPFIGVQTNQLTNQVHTPQIQEINMTVDKYGWNPDTFTVKKGIPVKWTITVKELTYCNKGIKVPNLGINYVFQKEGEVKVFEFTPTSTGTIYFTCWMGMIPGQINVID
jgi:sulfite exporter TauE/SafE